MRWLRRTVEAVGSFSILTKLLLSFFVIVIPLYAFNFYVNNVGADKNRKEISASLINSLRSYDKVLETEMQRIKVMQDQTAINIALKHTHISPQISDVEKTAMVLEIQRMLADLQKTSRFIENVRVDLPVFGTAISSSGATSGSDDDQAFTAMARKEEGGFFNYWNGGAYISSPYLYQTSAAGDGLFLLSTRIYGSSVKSLLGNMMVYKSGGAILYDLQQSWHLSTVPAPEIEQRIFRFLQAQPDIEPEGRIRYVDIEGESYLVAYERSGALNTVLAAYAKEDEVFGSLRTYRVFFWIMSALSCLIIILFSLWLYKIIHQPLKRLVNAFRKVERGSLQFSLQHMNKDEFGYLYEKFNNMVGQLNILIHEVYEQQLRTQRSELKRLQSQINPHFLYNSFFVLSRLIHSAGGEEKASRFSEHLGQYFQFITRDAPDDIRMEQEVKHARVYTDIQSVCYDKRIAVSFEELPAMFADVLVPRLILQPIIENAFKHAFENKLQDGRLVVRFANESGSDERPWLTVIVEDNGDQLSDAELDSLQRSLHNFNSFVEESTGLYNIHKRIQLRFGANSGLRLSRSALGGLKATLLLALDPPNSPDSPDA